MKRHRLLSFKLSPVIVWVLCANYLLFSVGIIKATHFCMGREASVAFFTSEVAKCACNESVEEREDCCDDQRTLLKLSDSQKTFSSFVLSLPDLTLLGELYPSHRIIITDPAGASVTFSGESPPARKILYRLYCSFVFYEDGSVA